MLRPLVNLRSLSFDVMGQGEPIKPQRLPVLECAVLENMAFPEWMCSVPSIKYVGFSRLRLPLSADSISLFSRISLKTRASFMRLSLAVHVCQG